MNIIESYNKGCLMMDYLKMDKAFEIFTEILKSNPEYYPAINKLGVIYANKGDILRARDYFEKALKFKDSYGPSLVNIGNTYKEEGKTDLAMEYYLTSINVDSDYYLAYYNMGIIYKEKKMYEEYMRYAKEYKRKYRYYVNSNRGVMKGLSIRRTALTNIMIPAIIFAIFAAIVFFR